MQKIILSIPELSRSNWNLVYRFIDGFYKSTLVEEVFNELQLKTTAITIANNSLDKDAYSAYGETLLFNSLPTKDKTTFSIIYLKKDDKEDFSDLVPFFLLKNKFRDKITLGIDVGSISLDKNKQNEYIFKCSDFLRFIDDKKPLLGKRSVYFINVKYIDKTTGEIRNYSLDNVTSLVGKGKTTNINNFSEKKNPKASRKYLPLLKIDEENFVEFFGQKSFLSEEAKYMLESTISLTKELYKKKFPSEDIPYHSLFEEWLTKAYFHSVGLTFDKIGRIKYEGLKNVLHAYCNNIYELVQNIIFHGGKFGLAYFIFNRKENISENQKIKIPDFEKYKNDERFIEIGIFDYGEQGIIDKYLFEANEKRNEDPVKYGDWINELKGISIKDFFDLNSILTTGINRPQLRYAANLGLKSFANSVLKHRGYFSIESNVAGGKCRIESIIEKDANDKNELNFGDIKTIDNISGTHYEMILPVKGEKTVYSTVTQARPQHSKLNDLLKKPPRVICEISFKDVLAGNFSWISLSKEQQQRNIEGIGEKLITLVKEKSTDNTIAINVSDFKDATAEFVYRLIAYIQLHSELPFESLILTHIDDNLLNDICEKIEIYLLPSNNQNNDWKIWNNNAPVVLISEKMRFQILCGEKLNEFLFINNEIKLKYPNFNYFSKRHVSADVSSQFKSIKDRLINHFYEFEIENDGKLLFEQYVLKILKCPIESEDIGYLVSHNNTRVGSKLIIKNFYEADSMFQSSFFTERLAYLIVCEIIKSKCLANIDNRHKTVLIGYKPYSELLVKSIKEMINSTCKLDTGSDIITTIITANEEESGNIIWRFDNKRIQNEIISNPNNYKYVTIVPIGSTLTTNDKIIAFFKLHVKKENIADIELNSNNFIYNHCAIVVRDVVGTNITKEESRQKWINIQNRYITTELQNLKNKEVVFSMEIGAKDENQNNWFSKFDKRFFPLQWQNEEYVNDTNNSSLNSQNLIGYPRVIKIDKKQYDIELKRLNELKDNIHFGHIESHKSHFRYYMDTEKYVRKTDTPEFDKWIENVNKRRCFKTDVLNVLITPNVNIQSDFVELIKSDFFDDNALIITIDVNNWRNNIISKFSYLREIRKSDKDSVMFHFVDHALLTSETYKKAKSYMLSILDDYENFYFESIITLINRLSYDRNEEIKKEVKEVYAFLNMFIPPSKDPETDCSLCDLEKYYKVLKENTVLETCNEVITKNRIKIKVTPFDSFTGKVGKSINMPTEQNSTLKERMFRRMKITHELFYQISNVAHKNIKIEEKDDEIKEVLDSFYDRIENNIDNKISFLKVISSPPLSQYIKLRIYGTQKLLKELDNTLQSTKFEYDTICVLRVILKQLSFLKSNALVRKEVIVKSWDLYYKCKPQIKDDIIQITHRIAATKKEKEELSLNHNRLEVLLKQKKDKKANLEKVKKIEEDAQVNIEKRKNFSQEIFTMNEGILKITREIENVDYEIESLLYKVSEIDVQLMNCQTDIECLDFSLSERRNINFQSKFQFYIKNATHNDEAKSMFLGELIRTGSESTLDIANISETVLKNSLFKNFDNEYIQSEIRDYKEFLVWLFYDNTTIMRKTLENFQNELNKDKKFNSYFYSADGKLKKFDIFKSGINHERGCKEEFENKVKFEYYYSNFEKYIDNPDKIQFVEKLLYVLYLKLKLNDLIENKHKKDIETDVKSLLKICAAIMEADAAFFAMRKAMVDESTNSVYFNIYALSEYGLSNVDLANITDDSSHYYTTDILMQVKEYYNYFPYPLISNGNIGSNFEESKSGRYNNLNLLLIEKGVDATDENQNITLFHESNEVTKKSDPLGAITFLYENNCTEDTFKKRSMEHGRLLLLLKNELNKYIIDYLINEKVFDIWVAKKESERKFNKLFIDNDHFMRKYRINDCDLDVLDIELFNKLFYSYLTHTNMIITYIYAKLSKKEPLNIPNGYDTLTPIFEIFDDKYCSFLKYKHDRWEGYVNIFNHVESNELFNTFFHKQLLRAFVLQCVDNALYVKHRQHEMKLLTLNIYKEYIEIRNNFPEVSDEELNSDKHDFELKKKNIKTMNCYNFSSMTLTSIEGYCNNHFECDYYYDDNNEFVVKIYLLKK